MDVLFNFGRNRKINFLRLLVKVLRSDPSKAPSFDQENLNAPIKVYLNPPTLHRDIGDMVAHWHHLCVLPSLSDDMGHLVGGMSVGVVRACKEYLFNHMPSSKWLCE